MYKITIKKKDVQKVAEEKNMPISDEQWIELCKFFKGFQGSGENAFNKLTADDYLIFLTGYESVEDKIDKDVVENGVIDDSTEFKFDYNEEELIITSYIEYIA